MGAGSHRPAVSVVIPTRNRESFIEAAVRGVMAQSLQDFEIVVGDDSETETTANIVEGIGDPRIRIYRCAPMDVYEKCKQLVGHARADLVAMLGDDDSISENYLETLVHALQTQAEVVAAYAPSTRQTLEGRVFSRTQPLPEMLEGGLRGFLAHWNQDVNERVARFWGIFRKKILEDGLAIPFLINPNRPLLARDFLVFFHACMSGKIAYCPEAAYSFLSHPRQSGGGRPRLFGLVDLDRFDFLDRLMGYAQLQRGTRELLDSGRYGEIPVEERVLFDYVLSHRLSQVWVAGIRSNLTMHAEVIEHFGEPRLAGQIRGGLGGVGGPDIPLLQLV